MKNILLITIAILLMFASWAFAQEDPEPAGPPSISYEVEIAWGARASGLTWAAAPVTSITTTPGDAGAHSYKWTTLGPVTWELQPIDYSATSPTKVEVLLDIAVMSGPYTNWGFYRVRVRGVADMPDPDPDVPGLWAEGYWVPVLDMAAPGSPGRP